ncbi:MAG: DUF4296 domain-containing protein [Dysgonamonadaceae bacterium]|jgi:hypothetical protein|nr:DUF4296 domain-containing protein [Dysgonamonadaceae bacterium]
MHSRVFVYCLLVLFVACTAKPAYVLSDKKMENVLFDLYIAQTEINENAAVFYNDSAKKQELLQTVFKKHKISQAKFDTSLVWYNAHLDRYMKINTQLTERYGRLINKLQTEIDRQKRRLRVDTLQFEDLNLKDFVTPSLFPWLTENPIDSVLPIDSVHPVLLPDSVRPIPEMDPDTLPDTLSAPAIRLPEQQRTVPITQKTEIMRESEIVDPAPIAIRKSRNKQK